MKKYIIATLAAVLAFGAVSCNKADKFQYGKEVILITGTDASPVAKERIVADVVPIGYTFSISATGKVEQDVTVGLKIDPSAVEEYNKANGTAYVAVPDQYLKLSSDSAVIPKGAATSGAVEVILNNNSFMEDGVIYVIAVSAVSVSGANMEILNASKSILIKLGKTQNNPALDMSNTGMYSTHTIGGYDLTSWTLEVKAYPTNLKSRGSDQLCRFCCWNEDGGGQVLLRFNENGKPWKTLDIVSVTGRYVTGTSGEGDEEVGFFEENKWHMISIVWDGSTMRVYVNGELDSPWENTISGSQGFKLNRFEIGMSYQGYGGAQSYSGRMSEMRIWNRARSQSEIAETLCSVDGMSEGLLGYWRMNEGSGTTFKDSARWTEDGEEKSEKDIHNMDWTKSERQITGETYSKTPDAASAIKWVKDAANNCLQ